MRVLIADDHGVVRGGLRLLLDRQPGVEVVGEAADGAEAVAAALALRPDLAILDVAMPKLTGLQAAREIKLQAPGVDVLMLSMHDDERYLFDALKAGASGYVLKHEADQALVDAVDAVGRGEPFLTNAAQRSLVRAWMADALDRPARAAEPARAGGPQARRRGPHEPGDRRGPAPARRRRSSPTGPTSCASSACATASSSSATRSGAG